MENFWLCYGKWWDGKFGLELLLLIDDSLCFRGLVGGYFWFRLKSFFWFVMWCVKDLVFERNEDIDM